MTTGCVVPAFTSTTPSLRPCSSISCRKQDMPPTRTTRSTETRSTRSSTRKRAGSPPPAPAAKRRAAAKPKAAPKSKPSQKEKEDKAPNPKRTSRPRRAPVRKTDRNAAYTSRPLNARQRDLPLLNPLPAPPSRERPCWQLFGWGPDNKDGPMGTGDEFAAEKPRRSKVVEKLIEDGEFGLNGAGLVAVAAGGFFSLVVDEIGQPGLSAVVSLSSQTIWYLGKSCTGTSWTQEALLSWQDWDTARRTRIHVWSFGNNEVGQLGRTTVKSADGVEVDSETSVPLHTPVRIRRLSDEFFRAVRIAAGSCIAAALSDRGELRVWGAYYFSQNSGGQKFMFSPHVDTQPFPVHIPELVGERFSDVVAGANHLVLLTVDGDVYTIGKGSEGQLGHKVPKATPTQGTVPYKVLRNTHGHRAVAIGASNDTSFFVDQQGDVWVWGLNGYGQTGTGSKQNVLWYPHQAKRVRRKDLGGKATVVQIVGGERHTLFLASDGRVFACGNAEDGQFQLPAGAEGDIAKEVARVSEPVPVQFPHDVKEDPVVQIAASNRMNAAITRDGVLYTWGLNSGGMLGTEVESPDDIIRTPKVIVRREGSWLAKVVSCGGQHCLALLRKKP
ncbi:regulator of chromosome condensation 1/beta-lactamase-inhibitor protein II [Dichomitus squalens]|nr:regulator of chromosome condensation 1/beta-lactamase-inhibitor protein II [Dichomitus squalens]